MQDIRIEDNEGNDIQVSGNPINHGVRIRINTETIIINGFQAEEIAGLILAVVKQYL